MNRYFTANKQHLTIIKTVTRKSESGTLSARHLHKLGELLDAEPGVEYTTFRQVVESALRPLNPGDFPRHGLREDTRANINFDAGPGWVAVYTGADRSPAFALGRHIDDLSRYEREYLKVAAQMMGIDLDDEA